MCMEDVKCLISVCYDYLLYFIHLIILIYLNDYFNIIDFLAFPLKLKIMNCLKGFIK